MKRKHALILFIGILVLAKLSEPDKRIEGRPREESIVWIEDGRVICGEGFFDLPKEEREELVRKAHESL